jgi:hypothetical protein
MSDFFGKLKSGAGKVAFEADKMTRLNKAKGELEQLKRQIDAQFTKLGELYFRRRINMETTGPAYDEICQAVVELERQVAAKDQEVQRIGAEVYAPAGTQQPAPAAAAPAQTTPPPPQPGPAVEAAPAPAAKFCPNCGKQLGPNAKFCPDCGTKVA